MNYQENRGRKPKYAWPKNKGDKLAVPFSKASRASAYAWAHRKALKFRTWQHGGKLWIEAI